MSKTITATIGERVAAINLLNAGKFSNSTLAVVLDDIKKFAVTEEEWVQAKLTKTPTDEAVSAMSAEDKVNVRQTWKWSAHAFTKDIEAGKETVDAILDMIKSKSDAKELTLQDGALLTLQSKLEA